MGRKSGAVKTQVITEDANKVSTPVTLTSTLTALVKELDVADFDKIIVYVDWLVKNATATLILAVESKPHDPTSQSNTRYFAISDQTLSQNAMKITPFRYAIPNLDLEGNTVGVDSVLRTSIALPIADGFLRFSVAGTVTSNSSLSAGKVSISTQISQISA